MTLEERLNVMEQALADAQRQLQRSHDREEISNLMSRHQYLFAANLCGQIVDELWSTDADIHLEEGASGVYIQFRDGVRDYYRQRYGAGCEAKPGQMRMDAITTPMIEVAADGRTAKGVWMSFGTETEVFPAGTQSGIPSVDAQQPDAYGNRHYAHWVWKKYAADFLHEAGGWKIWHLHLYDIFRCPFEQNWVTYALARDGDDAALDAKLRLDHGGITPERPTTFHWQYRPDTLVPFQPQLPEAYGTFADTFSY